MTISEKSPSGGARIPPRRLWPNPESSPGKAAWPSAAGWGQPAGLSSRGPTANLTRMRAIVASAAFTAVLLGKGICAAQTWGQQPPPRQQPGSDLEAGGLQPPSSQPEPEPQPADATEHELAAADREDSGRGLEFLWLLGEVGFQHLGLQTFEANELVDAGLVATTQSGPVYGGAVGLRLVFLTVGARFRYGAFPDWALWTLDAELGLRIPLGSIEPYFTFAGGYASVGAVDAGPIVQNDSVDITGWNLRGGGGLDWYLSEAFSLGANVTGDVLFLTRAAVTGAPAAGTADVYAADGSSIGAGVTVTAVAGLHF